MAREFRPETREFLKLGAAATAALAIAPGLLVSGCGGDSNAPSGYKPNGNYVEITTAGTKDYMFAPKGGGGGALPRLTVTEDSTALCGADLIIANAIGDTYTDKGNDGMVDYVQGLQMPALMSHGFTEQEIRVLSSFPHGAIVSSEQYRKERARKSGLYDKSVLNESQLAISDRACGIATKQFREAKRKILDDVRREY